MADNISEQDTGGVPDTIGDFLKKLDKEDAGEATATNWNIGKRAVVKEKGSGTEVAAIKQTVDKVAVPKLPPKRG